MASIEPTPNPRAGVIGTGFIGPVHIEALRRNNIEVTAICGSKTAGAIAERWGIPHTWSDYEAEKLIECPDVDVVHITSPDRRHHAHAMAALRAGKHVVCEKPLAINTRETREIVELAEQTRRVFAVHYNIRFYALMLELRAWIDRGELGEIIHVNGSYFQDWLMKPTDFNWRVLKEDGGPLRVVSDIGTHWMDLACFVQNTDIEAVFADLDILHEKRQRPLGSVETYSRGEHREMEWEEYTVETYDFAQLLLKFTNGAKGNLSASQVAAGRKNDVRLEVYGTKRAAIWNSTNPNTMTIGERDGPNREFLRNPALMSDLAAGYTDYPAAHAEGFPDSFKMLYRNIYAHIRGNTGVERHYADAREGHRELAVCEAVLRSAEQGAWCAVERLS